MTEEEPIHARLAVGLTTLGDREETMYTPAGRPTTVFKGQWTQNLPHSNQRKESGDKEDPDAKSYDEEEDSKTDKDTIIMEELHHTNFWAIMSIIQALTPTFTSLQLSSGRRLKGRQIHREIPSQGQDLYRGQTFVAVLCMLPTPEDFGIQLQQAMPSDTLATLRYFGKEGSCLSTFPEIFSLIEEKQGLSQRSWLERIATLLLMEQNLLLICLATQEMHIQVLWEVQYVTPSFTQAIIEEETGFTLS